MLPGLEQREIDLQKGRLPMSVNVAVIMGRLTKEPELRYTTTNKAVLACTVAVDRDYVKPGEERQADFIDVVAWGKTAEFVEKHFSKGQKIAIEGTIQTRTYKDRDGNNRKAVEVVARSVSFVERKQQDTMPEPSDDNIDKNGFVEVSDMDVPF